MRAKDKKEIFKKLIIDAWVNGHEQTSPHKGSIDYDADLECYFDKVSPIVDEICDGDTQTDTESGLHLVDITGSIFAITETDNYGRTIMHCCFKSQNAADKHLKDNKKYYEGCKVTEHEYCL